eukprot:9486027-Lingulodinium_polyedra.AAC.1
MPPPASASAESSSPSCSGRTNTSPGVKARSTKSAEHHAMPNAEEICSFPWRLRSSLVTVLLHFCTLSCATCVGAASTKHRRPFL